MQSKTMDHAAYQKKIKKLSDDALRHIIKDCKEVIEIQKSFNENIGYYTDEIHYCCMELDSRRDKKDITIIESNNPCNYCINGLQGYCTDCSTNNLIHFKGKKAKIIK
jgi:hypothetical protein